MHREYREVRYEYESGATYRRVPGRVRESLMRPQLIVALCSDASSVAAADVATLSGVVESRRVASRRNHVRQRA